MRYRRLSLSLSLSAVLLADLRNNNWHQPQRYINYDGHRPYHLKSLHPSSIIIHHLVIELNDNNCHPSCRHLIIKPMQTFGIDLSTWIHHLRPSSRYRPKSLPLSSMSRKQKSWGGKWGVMKVTAGGVQSDKSESASARRDDNHRHWRSFLETDCLRGASASASFEDPETAEKEQASSDFHTTSETRLRVCIWKAWKHVYVYASEKRRKAFPCMHPKSLNFQGCLSPIYRCMQQDCTSGVGADKDVLAKMCMIMSTYVTQTHINIRQTDRQTDRQADRCQADRQTYRCQTDRQMSDRQTDRQKDTRTHTQKTSGLLRINTCY